MESLYKKVKGVFIADLVVFPVFIIALIILFAVSAASAVASSSSLSSYSGASAATSGASLIIGILLYVLLGLYSLISFILKIVIYVETSKYQSLKETNIPLLFIIGIFVPIVWFVGAIIFIKDYKRLQ